MSSAQLLRTVTSYGRSAGSARVRVFDWLDWLALDVPNATYLNCASNSLSSLARSPLGVLAAEIRLRRLAREVTDETVLLSRQASPFSNGGVEERLLRAAARGVYDFDDALMHSPPGRLEQLWSKKKIWARSVAAADVVIAGNEFLRAEADSLNPSVVVVPSCVNPNDYERKNRYDIGDVPRAVWLGSPSTEAYLQLVARPLLELHRSIGLRLTLISAGAADVGALAPMVDRVQWSQQSVAANLAAADFGIMPLDDTPWTRGKCAYKLLQYGASRLPLVGSPVGVNCDVLSASAGFAPDSSDEWVSAIETLVDEAPEHRAHRGQRALETVLNSYSFAAWETTWRSALGLQPSTRL